MKPSTIADIIVATHLAYVLTVVVGLLLILVGGALRWKWVRNPWFRLIHLSMMLIVAIEAIFDITCPMTNWEDDLRNVDKGEASFIGRCVQNILFVEAPEGVLTICYITFAVLIVGSFFVLPPRRTMPLGTMAAIPHWIVGIVFVTLIKGPIGLPLGMLAIIDGTVWWWLGRERSPQQSMQAEQPRPDTAITVRS